MFEHLLDVNIISGVVPVLSYALSAALLIYLLCRRPTRRWLFTLGIGLLAGIVVAITLLILVERVWHSFGDPIGTPSRFWVVITCAALAVAVVNLWRSRWWRKLLAILAMLSFALSSTLLVNAAFGLNPTVGSFLHIVQHKPLTLAGGAAITVPGPLYRSWKPPAEMPSIGQTGTQEIPNPESGFQARPAGIYLPPAALVPNPPALPFVLMMMGQPGDPTPLYIQQTLDVYAQEHNGLAPVVVVADQTGNPDQDPMCLDTAKYGAVETYLTKDVLNWAKQNLPISQNPADWTVAGYSNGGECAIYLGAKYPAVFHNILDISGEQSQGYAVPDLVLRDGFNGDRAAFEAAKPLNILAAHHYPNSTAIFTFGGDDPVYGAQAAAVEAGARASGMKTTLAGIPGAGHGADALLGGLRIGFDVLYPRLGLSAPPE
ncbi:alpha/beta hydrolase-fold protein [Mycetocola spongiae]|uniref:alpha/beta hydrolase-fold protein n=1 Tax=Mycetocola spongiae TaxID=2859226 RepID=UPI001CF300B4|nr:alpha/beta hydrolase-fold protein [Mycetocola spongiae]UCR90350.1 hypothetical protein KXZ72_06800 [Mycetocola spongiae]